MPGGIAPIALRDIGSQGWNLLREDLPLPLAVLRESALAHNGDWMRRFLEASGAVYRAARQDDDEPAAIPPSDQ